MPEQIYGTLLMQSPRYDYRIKPRRCLACDRLFRSMNAGNRICQRCKAKPNRWLREPINLPNVHVDALMPDDTGE